MNVQAASALSFSSATSRLSSVRQYQAAASTGEAANIADTVHISRAAREALAASSSVSGDGAVDARLAGIRARGPVNRSQEDQQYLLTHDQRLAGIVAQGKSPDQLTADELDYMQKATGFVNTFATLSPAEKALYDKAVASGNTKAAEGFAQIALIRTGGLAGGAGGTTYDPSSIAITAANVASYFSHSIVDPTGKAQSSFQALIEFLQGKPAA